MRSSPNAHRLLHAVWPFLLIITVQAALASFCLQLSDTLRAFVNSGGIWVVASHDAIRHLSRYADSGAQQDYDDFLSKLSIPLNDALARRALVQQFPPKMEQARGYILRGGNPPDDIVSLSYGALFLYHLGIMQRGQQYWMQGDQLVQQMQALGEQLRLSRRSSSWQSADRERYLQRIHRIESELRPAENGFSFKFNRAARRLHTLMWLGNLATGALLALLTIRQVRRLLEQSDALNARLQDEKERIETTLESIGDAVITLDKRDHVTFLNGSAETLLSTRLADAAGRPFDAFCLLHGMSAAPPEAAAHAYDGRRTYPLVELMRHDQERLLVSLVAAPLRKQGLGQYGSVLVLHDKHAEQQYINKLAWQASHDTLTGLCNRREFEARAHQAIARLGNGPTLLALIFVDLDQFKLINDTHGHAAGDEMLCQLSRVLQSRLHGGDTLARLGGDEFGLLLEHGSQEAALAQAESLRRAIAGWRFSWNGVSFCTSASIGLVCLNDPSATLAEAMRTADIACYMAKEQGRNRIQQRWPGDAAVSARSSEMDWVQRLRQALHEKQFCLYIQNIVALNPKLPPGRRVEVLLRLPGPDGELASPAVFVPVAERYGLMTEIDRLVISQTFSQLHELRKAGDPSIHHCSINLSGPSLCDEGLFDYLQKQFQRYALPPELICFEITETAAIANLDAAQALIARLRAQGCHFSLDDFGAGMSSFAYLKHLPVDYLKIDGAFVRDMLNNPIDLAMVETINHIGHVAGKQTVAEFVESAAVAEALRAIGVDYAQGHHLHQPMPLQTLFPRQAPEKSTPLQG